MQVIEEFSISLVNKPGVLAVELDNSPGAMADLAGKLAVAHINISYAYCTGGARGGRTTGIIKVEHPAKAIKLLGAEKGHRDSPPIRRSQASRKP